MNQYEKAYKLNEQLNTSIVLKDLENASSYESLYWIGEYLYAHSDGEQDRNILNAFESAFQLGLNVQTDFNKFFDATQIVARLYYQYGDYESACNKLMILVENYDDVPDWVHLYYASAQIHTDNLNRIADNPLFFFARLDRINSDNEESVKRRDSIFKEFLFLLVSEFNPDNIDFEIAQKIFEKAIEYRLNESPELINFRDGFIIGVEIPELDRIIPPSECLLQIKPDELAKQREEIVRLESELIELSSLIKEKDLRISELENETTSAETLIEENHSIKAELDSKTSLIEQLREEIAALTCERTSEINAHDLLRRNQKLLVIGASEVKEQILRGVAKSNSRFENDDIEFVLEYDKIKSYTSRIKPWSSVYAGIIVGPCPHKTGDSGDYSSFIQKIKEEEGYPYLVEARDSSGGLKLSKESFKRALDRMVIHIHSVN